LTRLSTAVVSIMLLSASSTTLAPYRDVVRQLVGK
jgi:hypothetical protein